MISLLIIAALAAGAVAALAVYWKKIVEWIKRAMEKVKQIMQTVVEGVKTFVANTIDGIKNLAKYYSRNKISGEWEETVTRKAVDEREIPEELLARVRNAKTDVEIDTTEDLNKQLATLQH